MSGPMRIANRDSICTLLCLVLLASCTSTRPTLKIGLIAPFEGVHRSLGYEILGAVRLAVQQQNAAGGLNVKGAKRQIELISSDDRSDTETVVRTYEKLMGSDKVDLVLPPWGSNANFAVAPLALSLIHISEPTRPY